MNFKSKALYKVIAVTVFTFTLVIFGCTPRVTKPTKETAMKPVSSWNYPDFSDDMCYTGLEHSILKSLSYLQKIPAEREFVFGRDRYDTGHMILSLQQFLSFIQTRPSARDLSEYIQANYKVYRSVGCL